MGRKVSREGTVGATARSENAGLLGSFGVWLEGKREEAREIAPHTHTWSGWVGGPQYPPFPTGPQSSSVDPRFLVVIPIMKVRPSH